jgi:hypothetical protein
VDELVSGWPAAVQVGIAVGYELTEGQENRLIYRFWRWFAAIDETPHLCFCSETRPGPVEEGFDTSETCCLCLTCLSFCRKCSYNRPVSPYSCVSLRRRRWFTCIFTYRGDAGGNTDRSHAI